MTIGIGTILVEAHPITTEFQQCLHVITPILVIRTSAMGHWASRPYYTDYVDETA